jgi:hypothetical protein
MKIFFIKIFIMFILPLTGIGAYLFLIPSLPENSYNLAIIDKHRILAGTKSPKIVLAGGSNLAFGIDSMEIQNKFHIPVVNMGIHAGIGLGRILDDISPFLNSGDILLIVPEYSHFTDAWNGSGAAYELIFDVRQYRLLWSSYYGLPGGFSNYLSTSLELWGLLLLKKQIFSQEPIVQNPLAYSRDGFNEYGDYIKHLNMENQSFSSSNNLGTLNQAYLNHFFQLVDYFSGLGIMVILSYPCYEEQSFHNSTEFIKKLDMAFKAKENLLVISNPEFYCFPHDCFYDTFYHLNKKGRSMRTSQLIQDLQAGGLISPNNAQTF